MFHKIFNALTLYKVAAVRSLSHELNDLRDGSIGILELPYKHYTRRWNIVKAFIIYKEERDSASAFIRYEFNKT